ncbi:MAG: hypothetical protein KF905_15015 [Flavobacteriales bacterium]|nr:hypothetical protein [Flavobacteriales bacterium]
MRILAVLAILLPAWSAACTAFTTSHNGRTFIGCNEDSWSINANVRFEQGLVTPGLTRSRTYGTIYFANYNGHPTRAMADQLGMNEAGLVFDFLIVDHGPVKRRTGLPAVETSDAIRHIMRTCATVQEVEAYLRTVNTGPAVGQLFICDAHGGYLVLEPDTLFTGNDPWFAVGNWRTSKCSDPSTIPIPRLQAGRQLLMNGNDGSLEDAENVLSTMTACRKKLGEGTLYSVLFDPAELKAHLYFYHDFSERITFDLQEDIAKGDRTVDMASLFGPRPEYDRLKSYITPFHQRWLFWALFGVAVLALIMGTVNLVQLISRSVATLRGRKSGSLITPVLSGLASATLIALIGVLLMQEGVFYFGLGFTHPALVWLPWVLMVLVGALMVLRYRELIARRSLLGYALLYLPVIGLLGYWGMMW